MGILLIVFFVPILTLNTVLLFHLLFFADFCRFGGSAVVVRSHRGLFSFGEDGLDQRCSGEKCIVLVDGE